MNAGEERGNAYPAHDLGALLGGNLVVEAHDLDGEVGGEGRQRGLAAPGGGAPQRLAVLLAVLLETQPDALVQVVDL